MTQARICSIDGCGNAGRLTKGLCNLHYLRMRRHGDPLKTLIKATRRGEAAEFFELVVLRCKIDECLIWPYSNAGGRGTIKVEGRSHLVSRLVCEKMYGPPPKAAEAAHSCGNGDKGCVNPMHLRWASHRENEADKIGHGTSQHGERNHQAILSDEQVAEIRSIGTSRSQRAIAREFGVSQPAVSLILRGLRR